VSDISDTVVKLALTRDARLKGIMLNTEDADVASWPKWEKNGNVVKK
jgi:hypothetical protein